MKLIYYTLALLCLATSICCFAQTNSHSSLQMPPLRLSTAAITYGIFTTKGDTIVPFGRYNYIEARGRDVKRVNVDSKWPLKENISYMNSWRYKNWGIIDKNGKEIVPPKYESLTYLEGGFYTLWNKAEHKLIDSTGKLILDLKDRYTEGLCSSGIICFYGPDGEQRVLKKDGSIQRLPNCKCKLNRYGNRFITESFSMDPKYGLMDTIGNEILPIMYDRIVAVADKPQFWVAQKGEYRLCNEDGKPINDTIYSEIPDTSYHTYPSVVIENGKKYIIDKDLNTKVDVSEYDEVFSFNDYNNLVIAQVTKEELSNFITLKGELLLPKFYKQVIYVDSSLVVVKHQEGIFSIINLKNNTEKYLDSTYQYVRVCLNNPPYFETSKNRLEGLMDREGNEILPPKYTRTERYPYRFIIAIDSAKYRLFDWTGKQIGAAYDDMRFYEGAKFINVNIGSVPRTEYPHENYNNRPNGLWGLMDTTGKEVIPPQYDDIGVGADDRVVVKKNGTFGELNIKGEVVVPLIYSSFIHEVEDSLLIVGELPRYGLMITNLNTNLHNPLWAVYPEYRYVNNESYHNLLKSEKGKVGFLDAKQGRFVETANYDEFWDFETDLAIVKQNNKWGYINKDGKEQIAPILTYDAVFPFKGDDNKWAIVIKNRKYGCINRKGKEIIPPILDYLSPFVENKAIIVKQQLYGYINLKRKIVIPCRYTNATDFKNGKAKVRIDDRYFWIDTLGNEIANPYLFDDTYGGFYEKDKMLVRKGNKIGVAQASDNSLLCPTDYNEIIKLTRRYCSVRVNDKWGIFDLQQKTIAHQLQYSSINYDPHHYLSLVKQDTITLVDTNLQTIVSPVVANKILRLNDTLFLLFKKDNLPICVNQKGEWKFRIENQYVYEVEPFLDSLARINTSNDYTFFIDTNGKVIIPITELTQDYISNFSEGLAMVAENHRFGFINKKAQVVIPLQYESAFPFVECNGCYFYKGKARVMKNKRWIYIDKNGNCIENCE